MENDAAGVSEHRLAVAPNGKAVSAWLEDRSTSTQSLQSVHARAYSPDTGWGPVATYNVTGTEDAGKPQIAINSNGDAILVWLQTGATPGISRDFNIASVRYSATTGTWDAAPTNLLGVNEIPRAYTVDMDSHAVTLDDAGNSFYAIANRTIFDEPDGAWYKQYRNGTWTPTTRFLAGASSEGKEIALVAAPNGATATALWKQYDNNANKYRILASEYREGSGWTAGHAVDGDLAQSYGPARIAIAANGDTTAVWEASTTGGTRTDIYAARLTSSGWGQPAIIAGAGLTRDGYLADLCSDAAGNAVMVTLPFDLGQVAATRFTVASGWSAAEQVPPAGQNFVVPQASVACNTKGDALVAYRAGLTADNSYEVWTRPFVAGTGWGTPTQVVSIPGTRNIVVSSPVVGLDDSFRALALWRQDQQAGGLNQPDDLWGALFR